MKTITFIKKDNGLFPAFDSDRELFAGMKEGDLYSGPFTKPRNVKFLQKYWTLLDFAFENLPENYELRSLGGELLQIRNSKDINWHVKSQLGIYQRNVTLGGKITYDIGSISFAAMDEPEFEAFYDRAIDVIIKYFLVGTQKEDLIEHVVENY